MPTPAHHAEQTSTPPAVSITTTAYIGRDSSLGENSHELWTELPRYCSPENRQSHVVFDRDPGSGRNRIPFALLADQAVLRLVGRLLRPGEIVSLKVTAYPTPVDPQELQP